MVAVIKTGYSIRRIVHYNENKAKEGVAECIAAVNYPKDLGDLSLSNKLNRLLHQAALNEGVQRNSVHVSLNFDPSENLRNDQLNEIAVDYMQRIGFGDQPYLVYRHDDAAHPHIHIVSVKVRENARRIDTQFIGRNQSETARKAIEINFGLVKADDHARRQAFQPNPVSLQKALYGKSQTKRAITNVLDAVLDVYRYSSLHELNAVLGRYNVMADRGSESSRIYQSGGLVYRLVDDDGDKVGVPIKASDFYNNPTLLFLQERFQKNDQAKLSHKKRVKNAIDLAIFKHPGIGLPGLKGLLEKSGISLVERRNDDNYLYGITYIDHQTKCVFNGSSLDKRYGAKAIQERCNTKTISTSSAITADTRHSGSKTADLKTEKSPAHIASMLLPEPVKPAFIQHSSDPNSTSGLSPIDVLLQTEYSSGFVPTELKKNSKKKRKKKRISGNQ